MEDRRWVVARPPEGPYESSCLRLEERLLPTAADCKLLVETLLLSLNPTHLNWIKLDPQLQYLSIYAGGAMLGTNIGVARESRHANYAPGDCDRNVGLGAGCHSEPGTGSWAFPEADMPFDEQLTILLPCRASGCGRDAARRRYPARRPRRRLGGGGGATESSGRRSPRQGAVVSSGPPANRRRADISSRNSASTGRSTTGPSIQCRQSVSIFPWPAKGKLVA